MTAFTGGCLCGAVRLRATGQPYRVGLCHCLDCRKHHGALFYAAAIFPQDAVAIEGETMRQVTWVVIEEVKSGHWALGGKPLSTADVHALQAKRSAA